LKRVCSLATIEEKTGGDAAEEDRGAAVGEEVCTAGAVEEEEVMGGCSIAEEVVRKVF
jgi:hypothetical protein